MRILATVYLYGRFRAYGRASGATCAVIAIFEDSGQIAVAVQCGR